MAGRKPNSVTPIPPAPPSSLSPSEAEPKNGQRKRISIPLKEDGSIDKDAIRGPSRDRLGKLLKDDPAAFSEFGGDGVMVSSPAGPVTEEHISGLLSFYEQCIQWGIPLYLKQQTHGQFVIPQAIAEKNFRFSLDQRSRLCPKGAEFLNQTLPPWMLNMIAKTGPGAEFILGIAFGTWVMTQAAVAETKEWMAQNTVEGQYKPKPNGKADHAGVNIEVEEPVA